jgi:hypothetical protein
MLRGENMPPEFSEEDRIKILLWCERRCCLCEKACDTNIEIHHIEQKGKNLADIDNAIPLCFECHGRIKQYNPEHPKGTSYRNKEIKTRRDQIYEKYTRHLVPPIHFEITQVIRKNPNVPLMVFPNVGFNISHHGNFFLPVNALVEVKHILNGKDLGVMEDPTGYYSGEVEWNLNPTSIIFGNFSVPKECEKNKEDLKIEVRVTIIDQYRRPHKYLPHCWTYVRADNYWFLEPRSFTKWK